MFILAGRGNFSYAYLSKGFRIFQRMSSTTNLQKDEFRTVAIEGNIGCGKTRLLTHFSKYPETMVIEEPVEKWRNLKGHNLLGLMYEDSSRWGLTFQTYVQLTMLQAYQAEHTQKVKLIERSIYTAKYCFVENLYQSGKMPDVEYSVLSEWYDWILASGLVKLDLIVYLRTDPKVVYERILKRNRPEEHGLPYEYIKKLHQLHEDWLIDQKTFPLPAPVLVLDGNLDLEQMDRVYEDNSKAILFQ